MPRLLRELASGERIVVVATHDTRIMPFAERVVRLLPDFSAIDSEPETCGWQAVRCCSSRAAWGT